MTGVTGVTGVSSADLLERWDRQQAAYIAEREGRFAAMLDVLDLQCGGEPAVVVDLACGPGSLSFRVLERFPRARVLGVDHDPALLALAREAGERYGDRVAFVDDDLTADGWVERLRAHVGDEPVAGVVSTTALHWLSPAQLVAAYRDARDLLADDGVLLDGDHFRYDHRQPRLRSWAAEHDRRTQEAAFDRGAEPWDTWWSELSARAGYAELVAERDRRFADRPAPEATGVGFRLAALAQAGFAEHGTVWQLFDDFVVYGVA
ncbi:class I SAM-dependent methyltransferase [Nocardioides nitrophenolicus]|uniref:class I SAM-dependent methyltransferase n=1 Tax=Nocardioides nitrophenolicus TaxID=60489 RepID=UPI0027DE9834|nr:class I SAM-dependent methyltransferase [Nocardioides nitrophenolicus]MBM7517025.1 SAM-dependent methyltransferase [Nocardioides nitrophenolicus]